MIKFTIQSKHVKAITALRESPNYVFVKRSEILSGGEERIAKSLVFDTLAEAVATLVEESEAKIARHQKEIDHENKFLSTYRIIEKNLDKSERILIEEMEKDLARAKPDILKLEREILSS